MSAQQFQDPYNYTPQATPKQYTDIDSIWGKMAQGLGLVDRNEYERWLNQQNQAYERASINSARAWEEWFDSTAVQRRVEDIKAAGLNPWLALQSGNALGGASSSVSHGGSAKESLHSKSKSNVIQSIALSVIATAKLFAMFA